MRYLILLALAAVSAYPQADPNEAEQKKLIADITAKALEYTASLPNFVCTQVTRRNVDPTGTSQRWKLVDTINEELTFSGKKESYKVVAVNGKPANVTHDKLGGLTSSGEFGSILGYIFDPKAKAEFNWTQFESLRGHRVHTIGFKVAQANSQMTITAGKGQQVTASFFGLLYADTETGSVLRIALVAGDIPAKFAIQGVTMDLNYEFVKVAEQVYLLPLKADIHSKEGKSMIWNEVEFRGYRKFGADTAVKFQAK
jgi:hypothetical protein